MDAAAMLFDRFAGDGEAEAGTGRLRRKIRIEDAREHFGGYAGAIVLDGDDHFRVDRFAAEAYAAVRRGLEGVLDQVRDRAAEHASVSAEGLRRRRPDI